MLSTQSAVSPEAKAAAQDFLSGFKSFKDDVSKRMNEMSTRIERLDQKSARRPMLETAANERQPHQKAMASYIRKGDEDPMKSLGLEQKGLTSVADGGFLIAPQTAEMVEHVLRSGASLRGLAKVVNVESSAYDALVDHGDMGFDWVAEGASSGETPAPVIDRITIPLHELSASPAASQRILDDAAFDIETWLAERIADRFLRAESDAFVNGDGVNKPVGFLTKPMVANAGWSWGNIGYVASGNSGDFDPNNPGDALVELIYSLGADYRANAAFV
ncbi:MAG: phage major capsid protein, partial [Pseudomonadota bacterium]